MNKIYLYLLTLCIVIVGCTPETESIENELNENQDLMVSLETIAFDNKESQDLKSFVLSEDIDGNFIIEESDKVYSRERYTDLTESITSNYVQIVMEPGATRALTICCSSGRRFAKCTKCSGSNTRVCASNALKRCSSSSNKRDMVYNAKDNTFSIFSR